MSFSLLPFSNNSIPTIFCNCIILQQIRNLKIKNWFFTTSVLRHTASDHGPHWLSQWQRRACSVPSHWVPPIATCSHICLSYCLEGHGIVFYSCLDSLYFSFLPKLAVSMDESWFWSGLGQEEERAREGSKESLAGKERSGWGEDARMEQKAVLRRIEKAAKETSRSHRLIGWSGWGWGGEGQKGPLKVGGGNLRTNKKGYRILLQKEC